MNLNAAKSREMKKSKIFYAKRNISVALAALLIVYTIPAAAGPPSGPLPTAPPESKKSFSVCLAEDRGEEREELIFPGMNDSWPQVSFIEWMSPLGQTHYFWLAVSGIGGGYGEFQLTLAEANKNSPFEDWRHFLSPVLVENFGFGYDAPPGDSYVSKMRPGTYDYTHLIPSFTNNSEYTWPLRNKKRRTWPGSLIANPANPYEMVLFNHEEMPVGLLEIPEETNLPPGLWRGQCTNGKCLVKCNTADWEDQCQKNFSAFNECYRDPSDSRPDQPAAPTRSLVPYLNPGEPPWLEGEDYMGYCRTSNGMFAGLATSTTGGEWWYDHGRITQPPDWYRDPSDPRQNHFENPSYGADREPNLILGDVGGVGNPIAILVEDENRTKWIVAVFTNYLRPVIARARLDDVLGKNPTVSPSQAFHYWGRDSERDSILKWQTRSTVDPEAKGLAAAVLPVGTEFANAMNFRRFNTNGAAGFFAPVVSFFYSEALRTYVLVTGVFMNNRWERSDFAAFYFDGQSILDAPTDSRIANGKPARYYFKTFDAYRNVFNEVKRPAGGEVSRIENRCPNEPLAAYATVLGVPEPNRPDLGSSQIQGSKSRVFYTGGETDLPPGTHYSNYEILWSNSNEPPACPVTRVCGRR